MKNKILLFVILLMTVGMSTSHAQGRISKIFCPELNDTVAIERPEIGGAAIFYFSNKGTIDAFVINNALIDWSDCYKYPDKLLISLFLDFRKSFIFPSWEGITPYESITVTI